MPDEFAIAGKYAGLILDLDGCLWVGAGAVPGAPEAVDRWRAFGRALVFLTDEPRAEPEARLPRRWSPGLPGVLPRSG